MDINELIINELIRIKAKDIKDLSLVKRKASKSSKKPCPSNISLLKVYHTLVEKKSIKKDIKLEKLLRTRPVRSLSGIVNVSVLTKPYPCPGKCIYCPNEKGMPKSYLSGEPAAERAKNLKFDPYVQVQKRIEVLEMSGHPTSKIDLRVIGGTWSFYDIKYKIWFVKKCFDACNETKDTKEDYNKKDIKTLWKELEKAQKKNETSKYRMIGLSFETRPDFINQTEIDELRKFGATKIELGAQSIYDDVLKLNKRGHSTKELIEATRLLKEAGFKIAYQLMLNLPGSNPKRDIQMFKDVFSNQNYKPDHLKIYPCALVKEAPLYKEYLKGNYKPYTEKTLIETIKAIKKDIPRYVRIERIIRDIPSNLIIKGGSKVSNIRQYIEEQSKKEGWECNCIRCREIKDLKSKEKLYLFTEEYEASNEKELFLTFENKERTHLYALLRLRINKNQGMVRELHVYGQTASLSDNNSEVQHKGLGIKLVKEAEKLTKKHNLKKIAVISGVGVRDYYRKKLDYKLKDGYMIKSF